MGCENHLSAIAAADGLSRDTGRRALTSPSPSSSSAAGPARSQCKGVTQHCCNTVCTPHRDASTYIHTCIHTKG